FSCYLMRWLTLTSGVTPNSRLFAESSFWNSKYRELYLQHRPYRELDVVVGNPCEHFQSWVRHATPEVYDVLAPSPEQYAKIDFPICTITGQSDDEQSGAMEYYRQHMKHGSAAGRSRHCLIMGPWDHLGTRTPKREVGGLTFGEASMVDLNLFHRQWY